MKKTIALLCLLLLAVPVALQSSSVTINLLRLTFLRVGGMAPVEPSAKPYLTGIVHLLGGKGGPLLLTKLNSSPSLPKAWVDAFRWRLSWNDIVADYPLKSATGVASTDIVTVTGHGLVDTDAVYFKKLVGGAGLAAGTKYFARDVSGNTFKVALTSGGTAIDFTTNITSESSLLASVTGVASTDVITSKAHGLANTNEVYFKGLTGGTGLSNAITYYARDVTTDTFKVAATSGGTAINFTTDITAGGVRRLPLTYNWSHIDAALVTCAANGKKLSLSIVSGVGTPDWVYDTAPTCTRFPFTTNEALIAEMPLPFETGYQTKWLTFLAAFGTRYDGNPTLGAVFFTGVGQENVELHITGNGTDEAAWNAAAVAALYADKSAAFRAAATLIVDAFVTAFPTTPTMFTSGNPWGGGLPGVEDRDFINNYVTGKPDKLRGLCSSYLHALAASEHTNAGWKRGVPQGDQAIFASTDQVRFYSDPIPNPFPAPPTPVYDLLQAGYEKGDQYVEVYEYDLAPTGNPTVNDGVLASQRLKLIENAQP